MYFSGSLGYATYLQHLEEEAKNDTSYMNDIQKKIKVKQPSGIIAYNFLYNVRTLAPLRYVS